MYPVRQMITRMSADHCPFQCILVAPRRPRSMQHLAASAVLRAAVAAPSGIQPATSTALEALHCLSRQSGCISTLLPPVTRGLASAADDLSRSSLAACDGPELRRLLRPAGLQSMLPAARIATALSSAASQCATGFGASPASFHTATGRDCGVCGVHLHGTRHVTFKACSLQPCSCSKPDLRCSPWLLQLRRYGPRRPLPPFTISLNYAVNRTNANILSKS